MSSVATCNEGVVDIPFNSRTYFYDDEPVFDFDENATACDAAIRPADQNCTSYTRGAFFLSARVLQYDVDLSRTECGCNAAMYLAAMPTNDELSVCGDHYCDANGICETYCAEIDIMEANTVAWKSVVHHKYDRSGEAYGWGRWSIDDSAFALLEGNGQQYQCLYGPSEICAINTMQIFRASFAFSDTSASDSFGFETVLTQGGRSIIAASVKYTQPTPYINNEQLSAALSNRRVATAFDGGLTLVASYWGGPNLDSNSWLDNPCDEEGCQDVFTGHDDWPWICRGSGPTNCNRSYRISNIKVTSPEDLSSTSARQISDVIDTFFVPMFHPEGYPAETPSPITQSPERAATTTSGHNMKGGFPRSLWMILLPAWSLLTWL